MLGTRQATCEPAEICTGAALTSAGGTHEDLTRRIYLFFSAPLVTTQRPVDRLASRRSASRSRTEPELAPLARWRRPCGGLLLLGELRTCRLREPWRRLLLRWPGLALVTSLSPTMDRLPTPTKACLALHLQRSLRPWRHPACCLPRRTVFPRPRSLRRTWHTEFGPGFGLFDGKIDGLLGVPVGLWLLRLLDGLLLHKTQRRC